MYVFLKCFGQAFLKHGLKAAADLVPFGRAALDIAADGWANYCKEAEVESVQGEVLQVAEASNGDLEQAASDVVKIIASNRPPTEQQLLLQYLQQIAFSIRESPRRNAHIEKIEDLAPLLPPALTRFRERCIWVCTGLQLLEAGCSFEHGINRGKAKKRLGHQRVKWQPVKDAGLIDWCHPLRPDGNPKQELTVWLTTSGLKLANSVPTTVRSEVMKTIETYS
jgi:hypothetical protein